LQPFFEELHDDELQEGYFQQDGATPHCTNETLTMLQAFYSDRIISRNTGIPWPPRSYDLAPCDFFLWPHIKNSIYTTPINDLDDLSQRIRVKIEEINNAPNMLENVINGLKTRILSCSEEEGRHFQHLI
jgi:hypothetical protein